MTCNNKSSKTKASYTYGSSIDNILSEVLNSFSNLDFQGEETPKAFRPPTNLIEFEDSFEVQLAIPGFKKETIELHLDNSLLKISSVDKSDDEAKGSFRLREFNKVSFEKSIKLPKSADSSKIDAVLVDGILRITINKKEEAIPRSPQKINIQ